MTTAATAILPTAALAVLLLLIGQAAGAGGHLAEVWSGDALVIEGGLSGTDDVVADGGADDVVRFGDELVLELAIAYDPDAVLVADPGEALFSTAWTPAEGVYLKGYTAVNESADAPRSAVLRLKYRFQVLGCPDTSSPTCPGDREYALPPFVLAWVERESGAARSARFRLQQRTLTVTTLIERDAENQLFPFEVYFPNGAYPEPLAGRDGTRGALLAAGLAIAILTGGILMWPFRTRRDEAAADAVPRWKKKLDELRRAEPGDDARYLDALRRCLVWYCNDELEVDAFVWLDLAERGDEVRDAVEDDVSFAKLRDLFIELLHNPAGKGPELRSRLESLIAQGGHA